MFEKMSDGDVMVYLRNAALALSKLACERKVRIDVYCTDDGYIDAEIGDYRVFRLDTEEDARYDYRLLGSNCSYMRGLSPQKVRFGKEPYGMED